MFKKIRQYVLPVVVALALGALLTSVVGGQSLIFEWPGHMVFRILDPLVKVDGTFTVEKKSDGTDMLTVSQAGLGTFTGGVVATTGAFSGAVSGTTGDFSGVTTGPKRFVTGTTATYALTAAMCGSVYTAMATTGTQVYTLPAATNGGCMFTFILGHAGGEILINTAADGDGFVLPIFDTAADLGSILTEAGGATGIKNTAATNVIGDNATIVADGTVTWRGVGLAVGIWAAQ